MSQRSISSLRLPPDALLPTGVELVVAEGALNAFLPARPDLLPRACPL